MAPTDRIPVSLLL